MRVVVVLGIVLSCMSGAWTPDMPIIGPSLAYARSCDARENLDEVAMSFIIRCCKAALLATTSSCESAQTAHRGRRDPGGDA